MKSMYLIQTRFKINGAPRDVHSSSYVGGEDEWDAIETHKKSLKTNYGVIEDFFIKRLVRVGEYGTVMKDLLTNKEGAE